MEMESGGVLKKFENRFIDFLQQRGSFSDIVFVCIGTKKLIGDSIGPVIGEELKELENEFVHVYGTIDKNVNFINGKEIIEEINRKYKEPYLITIDAALSTTNRKGDIILGSGYMKIGKALNKSVCFFSNLNIKCVIGKYYNNKEDNLRELSSVRVSDVHRASRVVTDGIKNSFKKLNIYV